MDQTKLAIILHRRGLSQHEALDIINMHTDKNFPQYRLSKMINGKSEPATLTTLRLLKDAFGIKSYDDLIDN